MYGIHISYHYISGNLADTPALEAWVVYPCTGLWIQRSQLIQPQGGPVQFFHAPVQAQVNAEFCQEGYLTWNQSLISHVNHKQNFHTDQPWPELTTTGAVDQ